MSIMQGCVVTGVLQSGGGGLTITGMDTMMVGWWVGKSYLVKMHYAGVCF